MVGAFRERVASWPVRPGPVGFVLSAVLLLICVGYAMYGGSSVGGVILVGLVGVVVGFVSLWLPHRLSVPSTGLFVIPPLALVAGYIGAVRLGGVSAYPWVGAWFLGVTAAAQLVGSARSAPGSSTTRAPNVP